MNKQKEIQLKQKVMLLARQKKYKQACKIAIKLSQELPNDIEVWWAVAQLQIKLGEYENAVKSFYKVCQKPSPYYVEAIEIAVEICIDHEFWQLGLAPAKELVKINPKSASAHYRHGVCWFYLNHYFSAKESFLKCIELQPNETEYLNKCGLIYNYIGEPETALKYFQRSETADRKDIKSKVYTSWAMNYIDNIPEVTLFEAHKKLAACYEKKLKNSSWLPDINDGQKLRIGFYSQDFYRHSVAYFLLPIVRCYNKERWEIYCYSDVKREDAVTEEIRNLTDNWRICKEMTDAELIKCIRADQVDIIIDLAGLTGDNRLGAFAERCAPVQATYLGYPNTTGITCMDYRLTDECTDPSGKTDQFHSETLIRLPKGFLCFEPDEAAPPIIELPTKDNAITFGSFNVFQKISERNIKLWSRILSALPDSKLLIKSKPLHDEKLQEHVWKKFEDQGISRDRITLVGLTADRIEHLNMLAKVAIHLDTFPYNGTTTTCEALWQGVPTVTLAGENHRSRVGMSIMHQMGLDDWVAHCDEEYFSIAISKANDIASLRRLRTSMRKTMQTSALMDAKGFIKQLENTFDRMQEITRSP